MQTEENSTCAGDVGKSGYERKDAKLLVSKSRESLATGLSASTPVACLTCLTAHEAFGRHRMEDNGKDMCEVCESNVLAL